MTDHTTAEQKAREMLERIGVDDASSFSAGAVVELANLIDALEQTRDELSDAHESLDIAYLKGRVDGRDRERARIRKDILQVMLAASPKPGDGE